MAPRSERPAPPACGRCGDDAGPLVAGLLLPMLGGWRPRGGRAAQAARRVPALEGEVNEETAAKLAERRRERALAKFRETLPPAESELRLCPEGCSVDHDAEKKTQDAGGA